MELNELQNRLTNIITGISNLGPRIIQGITQGFIKYYIPDQIWVISITDIEGIEQTAIGYYIPIRPYNNPRLRQYYLPRLIYLTQGLT